MNKAKWQGLMSVGQTSNFGLDLGWIKFALKSDRIRVKGKPSINTWTLDTMRWDTQEGISLDGTLYLEKAQSASNKLIIQALKDALQLMEDQSND